VSTLSNVIVFTVFIYTMDVNSRLLLYRGKCFDTIIIISINQAG